MATLQITCLGDCQIALDGTPPNTTFTEKARSLLIYLVLEPQVHPRGWLTQMLWSGYNEESARNSLRQALHLLRQFLPEQEIPWLLLTRQTVQINPAAPIHSDVTTFTRLLAAVTTHAHTDLATCTTCLTGLRQAVDLYRGDFLANLSAIDSDVFEEWRRVTQEQLHIQMLDALARLADITESIGDTEGALQTAQRQLTLEPWLEAAHRQIMRLLAQRGQRVAALAQYQRCRQVLAEELSVEPEEETTALYKQIRDGGFDKGTRRQEDRKIGRGEDKETGGQGGASSLSPLPVFFSSAPVQLPPLLGRTEELAQMTTLLAQPTCRLVTLVGPPGVGKTRLAQEILDSPPAPGVSENPKFTHGRHFIDLAPLRDPTLLAPTIAHALSLSAPTVQLTGERLTEQLRDQALLLVLDNFEQVLPGVDLLRQILTHCPQIKFVITSRVPLHLPGEQVIPVHPLPLPGPLGSLQGAVALATAAQNVAVQLFCQRAAAVLPGFVLTERLAPVVVEICRRLDGLPLAIELAAARCRLLPPPALLERLTQELPARLELLTNRSPTLPERQQTLRAAIAWSYDLLTADEQRLFRQMAVFVGGATLSALEAVIRHDNAAGASPPPPPALLDNIEALLDKSLLRQQEAATHQPEGEPRLQMLETLREYGWELLAATADKGRSTQQRHADYFLNLAETAAPNLHGPEQVAWLDRLALDHDNLRAALDWLVQAGEATKALRLATALRYFWRVRGHYREGSERLQQILARPEAASAGSPANAVLATVRARALNAAGYLQWVQGNAVAAQDLLQEALTLGRAVPDAAATAFALRYLGLAANARRERTTARQLLEESLAIYRSLDTPNETALALMYLGDVAFSQQAYAEAEQRYQESADLLRGLGNNVVLPYALRHLGYLALVRGNLQTALALCTESLRLNLAAGEQQGSAAALTALATVAVAGEQWTPATRLLAAVTAWLAASRAQLLPFDRAYYEQTVQLLQQRRQENPSDVLVDGAALLSLEGALAYVEQELAFADESRRQGAKVTSEAVTGDSVTESPPHPVAPSSSRPLSPPPLYNLPTVLPPLIGRERDLAEIVSRLRQPGARLLTLAGPGGMGKTRLALAAAAQVAPHFAAGVCLVELAELTEPVLLPQIVAAALGQTKPAEAGGEDPVARYLADKALLLVLDNCEHVAEAAANWSKRWLNACPRLCILATSHGALTVPGEAVWLIPTLAYPPPTELAADQLLAFAAVQLFVARAREVKADFALTAANGSAIAEICRRLDGIPLALELAAARVRLLTPTEIAARLHKGIAAALANNRSAPARHQTMQAALDWSFASLDADEQRLFQQLAVFAGGFTLPAVESVTQLLDAPDRLERLIDRALVITETLDEQTRYRLLGVIRKYAADKLGAGGMALAQRWRHAAYFLQLAESAQMDIQADGEALWLQPEAENLSGAVDWALANAEAAVAVRLAGALTWYWWIRGYLRSQRPALQQAMASLALANQPQASIARRDEAVEAALLALAAGALFALWEEPDKARLAFAQALALAEAAQHQHLIGLALRRLAAVAIGQKAYEAANAFIERGLAVWQALGAIWHVAWLYALQGDLADQRGDQAQAWLAYEASSRLPVDPGARAYPFRRMAYLALARGDRSEALALCRESLQLNRATGDRQGIAACLVGVARFTVAGAQTLPQAARLPLLRRATELLGAVDTLLQTVEGRLLQADEVAYQQTIHALQEQLATIAPETYGAALAAGRASTVEQATALALQEETIVPSVETLRPQEPVGSQGDKGRRWQGEAVISTSSVTESPSHPVTQSPPLLATQSPLLDWAEMPLVDFFVERRAEVAQLTEWLTPTAAGGGSAQLISILGMGGMGKTTLAAAVTAAVAPSFAVVIWRSLLNAPPLSELLRNWLQTLSRQTLTTLPASLDEQLRLLLTYLQQERCLLVLDNVESIFVADTPAPVGAAQLQSRAGVTRAGYEGYDQLFQRLASSNHQSCLLLTSREQPYALLRIATGRRGQTQPTARLQVLPLAGLNQAAGQTLLASNGLHAAAAEAAQLVENYSGNPLALQIVAATIADFFGGDVAAFRQEDGGLFDGMRLVLDQQFARLSPLEREILVWLAIEREAIPIQTLRANLVSPVTMPQLLEVLQALQNRSLLEKRDADLTLQNVIIEYTTSYLVEQVCQEIIDELRAQRASVQLGISFLNRFALLKAQAKEYVRQSQVRMLIQPVAERLVAQLGKTALLTQAPHLLDRLRAANVKMGYAAGNLLNLLLHLGVDLSGYDFSHLSVWQADLHSSMAQNINFTQADLSHSSFIQTFSRIEDVAISPDGQLLAAAGDGGVIRLFRLPTGEPHLMLTGHTNTITSIAFSPSGAYLVSTGDDGTIRLWTINDGCLHQQFDEQMPMRAVAFSPDGNLLAGASRNGTVLLWQVESGHLLSALPLHKQRVDALAFHPDGNLLASAGTDGVICFLDVSNFQHHGNARSAGLAVLNDNQQDKLPVQILVADPNTRFFTAAFSQDGKRFVAGGGDGKLHVWHAPFDQAPQQILAHRGEIRTAAFCVDSTLLFSGGYDGVIRLWDSNELHCLQTLIGHEETVYAIALGPNDQLMATGSEDATICLWEVHKQTQSILRQRIYGYPQALECVAWSGCGRWLATGDIHGSVRLWDLQSAVPRCTQEITGESTVISVDFTSDGQQIVIGRYADPNGIQIWAVGADDRWHLRGGRKIPMTGIACFSPNGDLIATCGNDGNLRLWNEQTLAQRTEIVLFTGRNNYVNRLAFTPEGQMLASCSSDQTVRLWRIERGEEVQRLPGSGNNTCLAVNAQGTLLACSAPGFTIALWHLADPASKQPFCNLRGHTNEAFACAFSPDGKLLVSAGLDRSVRLWDVQTGTQLTLLGHHEQYALGVAFSPDGKQVASIGKEGALYLWRLDTYECIHKLRAPGPYAGMKITGVTGISEAQKAALTALGAVDE